MRYNLSTAKSCSVSYAYTLFVFTKFNQYFIYFMDYDWNVEIIKLLNIGQDRKKSVPCEDCSVKHVPEWMCKVCNSLTQPDLVNLILILPFRSRRHRERVPYPLKMTQFLFQWPLLTHFLLRGFKAITITSIFYHYNGDENRIRTWEFNFKDCVVIYVFSFSIFRFEANYILNFKLACK